jgi:hypothetical protein
MGTHKKKRKKKRERRKGRAGRIMMQELGRYRWGRSHSSMLGLNATDGCTDLKVASSQPHAEHKWGLL